MPTIVPVDDPDDPRIAAYRCVRERDLVGRDGLFMAEGAVVLHHLLTSPRHRPVSLLLAENRVAPLADALEGLPDSVPVYCAAQPVLDAVVGFPLHRGILALGRPPPAPDADALLAAAGPRALVAVLLGIGNHDNMGGIFRNAAAFGLDAVLLDAGCCDPLYRKAIRVSVGATLRVPYARLGREADPVAVLERHGFTAVALSPTGGTDLAGLRRAPRMAALFGAEGPGLPAAVLGRLAGVRIPMAAGFDSLNVATTSGIVLHHLAWVAETVDLAD
ncbi:TrmH family RNA methyltransferase [Azospirillum halopraeferens]|uniref:TrmH family RNA methyltransferase n=1 Tax=Azospirillum halopraeferens TaxID=34010 RepID=UPI000410BEB9|nr:RNA methyltransferase [Azospirillum halopraeferens]